MPYQVTASANMRGLNESRAAFRAMAPIVAAAHGAVLKVISVEVRDAGRGAYVSREGGTRERRQPGSIGTDFSGDRFVVFIERDGTSPAAEFGAKTHHVFGRKVTQRSMKARTAGGWSRKGKLVGPQLEPYKVTRHSRRVADDGLKAMSKTLDRYGVPRA